MSLVFPQAHIFKTFKGNLIIYVDSVMTVTCDDIITLRAEIKGNLLNHSFLWSQISGTDVEWLEEQDQEIVMFRQPQTRDDKVFRFTVDKDTKIEQNFDILVTAVPREIITTKIIKKPLNLFTTGLFITDDKLIIIPTYKGPNRIDFDLKEKSILINIEGILPSDVILYRFTDGVDIPLSEKRTLITSNNHLTTGLEIDKSYRIRLKSKTEDSLSPFKSFQYDEFYINICINEEPIYITSCQIDFNFQIIDVFNPVIKTLIELEKDHKYFSGIRTINESESTVEEFFQPKINTNNFGNEIVVINSLKNQITSHSSIVEVKAFQHSSLG